LSNRSKAGLPVIARMRVASGLGLLSGLEPVQAEPVLAALPDDAARAAPAPK
jgi:hypothetical protein